MKAIVADVVKLDRTSALKTNFRGERINPEQPVPHGDNIPFPAS